MRRPDLDEDGKYDGWQVLDPTPQEKSEGTDSFTPHNVFLPGERSMFFEGFSYCAQEEILT